MDAFSYPFRFAGQRVARVDSASDEYGAQLIAAAIQTNRGELPMMADFGSLEATFSQFDEAGFVRTIAAYVRNVRINSVDRVIDGDGTVKVTVEYSMR